VHDDLYDAGDAAIVNKGQPKRIESCSPVSDPLSVSLAINKISEKEVSYHVLSPPVYFNDSLIKWTRLMCWRQGDFSNSLKKEEAAASSI
jgi:hypothetical protein